MIPAQLKLNIGCGAEPTEGWVNVDVRPLAGAVGVQGDINRLPFGDGQFHFILADSVLEHLRDPRVAIAELRRTVDPAGSVLVRVPALGAMAAHLDPTHRYLADLHHWVQLLEEQFERVRVCSVGVRYRHHRSLVVIQYLLIKVFGWHELGQCWELTASRPRLQPIAKIPRRWWLD